jgi:hypothetical protein
MWGTIKTQAARTAGTFQNALDAVLKSALLQGFDISAFNNPEDLNRRKQR